MTFCIFDAHADTISRLLDNGEDIFKSSGQLDLNRMKNTGFPYVQIFAAFTERIDNPALRVLKIIDKYYEFVSESDILVHCLSAEDIERNICCGKILSLLSIEGGDALLGSLEMLRNFYRLGVRVVTLTWNFGNEIADGILEKRGSGLTGFGAEVVRGMNRLGMIIDVSHLSEKGFWDVARISSKPFIASHSNARKLCSNTRNLTDEQIKEIIRINGCIGLNFYPDFLNNDGKSSIKDIVKHADYILSLGGENVLGFGSDFDGVDRLPCGISGAESYPDIINEFLRMGYSEELVKKICFGNFFRVFKEILR